MRLLSIVGSVVVLGATVLLVVHCSQTATQRYVVQPCPDAAAIKAKYDLWRYGTCLRGANIWQTVVDPAVDSDVFGSDTLGPPYAQGDFDALAALGANYVNLSVPGIFSERKPYSLRPEVLDSLNNLIERAERAKLFVVVSFRTGPGRNEAGFTGSGRGRAINVIWTDADAQTGWVAMWKRAATEWKSQGAVVGYDLMVEPNSNQVYFNIWDPEEFYPKYKGTTYDWNVLAARLAKGIRDVDAKTPILVGALDSSDALWLPALEPLGVENAVYAIHQYRPNNYTGLPVPNPALTYPGVFEPDHQGDIENIDRNWIGAVLDTVDTFRDQNRAPVAVNEFGLMRWEYGSPAFLRDELDWFELKGLNHAVWLWESSWPKIDYHQFDFRFGTDFNATHDVPDNDLVKALKASWSRNKVTPENVSF